MPVITSLGSTESAYPIEVGSIIETSKAINTDWFAANISPKKSPALHRIMLRCATSTVVKIEFDDGATTNVELDLNDGANCDAGEVYIFDIIVLSGQSYNIQHETATQNIMCSVIELQQLQG